MQPTYGPRTVRRANGGRHRRNGSAGRAAVAFPLFLFAAFSLLAIAGFVGAVGAYAYFSRGLTDPTQLERIEFNQESVVYDRTGKVELARFGSERREVVEFREIPPLVLDATTAVEDKSFWTNTGFDPAGFAAAARDTLAGDERGGSTITQQLVRQRLLDEELVKDPGRRWERKAKEIIQSVRITQAFPGLEGKQRIIAAYLNQNFYGNNSHGIKAAARTYFGVRDLNKLTLAQAAILAAIPQSPTKYDLVRNAVEEEGADGRTVLVVPDEAEIVHRRNYVLDLMASGRTPLTGDRFGAADYEAAKRERVMLAPQAAPRWRAPHFVWAVRKELASRLCGEGEETCPALEKGGVRVITTLDWDLQQVGERWVKASAVLPRQKDPREYAKRLELPYEAWMARLRGRQLHNGALVATDYQTGEIVAYVGSADYYGRANRRFQPQFDVLADGWRQPGSAFKPFNYITGFDDRRMTAATMLMDVTTDFGNGYTPTNADNLERGPVRVRSALQFSLNIPAVKAVANNGVERVFENSERFEIRWRNETTKAGLSLALGTEEVHPVDLTTAFGTIANGGRYIGHTRILRITDMDGRDVVRPYQPPKGEQVATPQAAYIMTDILSGNTIPSVNPYWGRFRIRTEGGRRRPATLKTGTNNDAKDLNAYGYIAPPTSEGRARGEYALVVGVWNGNSDNSVVTTPNRPVFSVDVTAPVWRGFLREATANWEVNDFARPSGIVEADVDAWSGMRPSRYTRRTVRELFIDGSQPSELDDTKVGHRVEAETNLLWQDGCAGEPVERGFLDLEDAESHRPAWNEANRAWLRRARRGPGVAGGPEGTSTTYFFNGSFMPFGASWGAPFPPRDRCEIAPSPSPTPSLSPSPSAPGSPVPSPGGSPTPPPSPSESPVGGDPGGSLDPDSSPVAAP